jgi:hypothetical protein
MVFIPIKLNDVQEGEPVPEGEYDLQIVKAEAGESKKGSAMVTVSLRVLDEPSANLVRHWIVLPNSQTSDDQRLLRERDIARFCHAFGIDYSGGGFDTDDFPGQTARIFVTKEVGEDNNEYNKLRLPRLPKSE